MGFFWASLFTLIGPLVYRVVASLGMGFVTYTGVNMLTDQLLDLAQSETAALPPQMFQIVAMLHLDDAIALIVSAVVAKLTLIGMSSVGSIRKQVWNTPGSQDISA